jgi:AAA15 family ATPase/GTPase
MNSEFFSNIKIENFKSLRSVEINDCKRINLFIGRPNVGKSNILEALSLFSLSHSRLNAPQSWGASLQGFIRAENQNELFYNGGQNENLTSSVMTDLISATISFSSNEGFIIKIENKESSELIELKENFKSYENTALKHHKPYERAYKKVKKYIFNNNKFQISSRYSSFSKYNFLRPPFGGNLMKVIESLPDLAKDCERFFSEYGLQMVFDQSSASLRLMKTLKKNGDSISKIILYPYSSIADTLQRIIFYKAAIASNENSILLFEEPEAHAFPPYISHITQEMIDSKTNQFFVTTHSPFVLNDLLENAREDLSVFIVDWKDGETTVKRLTDNELYEAYQYGIDFFTNIETFI